MEFNPAPQNDSSARPTVAADRILSSRRVPILVRCNGSFVFDLQKQSASFSNQVVVQQKDEFQDTLRCELLELFFDGEQLGIVDPTDPNTQRQMQIQRIVARGQPALIEAHSRQTRIAGSQLEYDILRNRVHAMSSDQQVVIANANYRFQAASLDYQIPDDQSLGELDARGPGKMTRFRTKDEEEFHAEWSNLLTVRPDADKKMVTLDGETRVQLDRTTKVSAQHMRIWLWEIPQAKANNRMAYVYLPAQLFMKGDVEINSPRLTGTANQLSAFWPEPSEPVGMTTEAGVQHFVARRPQYPGQKTKQGIQFFPPLGPPAAVQQVQFVEELGGHGSPAKKPRQFSFNRANSLGSAIRPHSRGPNYRTQDSWRRFDQRNLGKSAREDASFHHGARTADESARSTVLSNVCPGNAGNDGQHSRQRAAVDRSQHSSGSGG